MKTRVTFRIAEELAAGLRTLPNQTQFVEEALRHALGRTCPVCEGTGRVTRSAIRVSNFREAKLPKLDRESALRLRGLVKVGRNLAATRIALRPDTDRTLGFVLERGDDVLLRGTLN